MSLKRKTGRKRKRQRYIKDQISENRKEGNKVRNLNTRLDIKGTVQRDLRGVKSGIDR